MTPRTIETAVPDPPCPSCGGRLAEPTDCDAGRFCPACGYRETDPAVAVLNGEEE